MWKWEYNWDFLKYFQGNSELGNASYGRQCKWDMLPKTRERTERIYTE